MLRRTYSHIAQVVLQPGRGHTESVRTTTTFRQAVLNLPSNSRELSGGYLLDLLAGFCPVAGEIPALARIRNTASSAPGDHQDHLAMRLLPSRLLRTPNRIRFSHLHPPPAAPAISRYRPQPVLLRTYLQENKQSRRNTTFNHNGPCR